MFYASKVYGFWGSKPRWVYFFGTLTIFFVLSITGWPLALLVPNAGPTSNEGAVCALIQIASGSALTYWAHRRWLTARIYWLGMTLTAEYREALFGPNPQFEQELMDRMGWHDMDAFYEAVHQYDLGHRTDPE